MNAEHAVAVVGSPLARRLTLPHAVLFGLGVTIGAGIYVLIGAAAGRAGMAAPVAFLIAALVMAPTAAAFAELAGRMPVSAGEAAYVRAGLGSNVMALLVGLMVIAVGVISAAAIARGSTGYIREFVPLPVPVVLTFVILAMGLIAAKGIVESVTLAGIMTLIEVTGLLAIVALGAARAPDMLARLPEAWPGLGPGSLTVWSGVFSASLLAFFAFIGFEGLANIAEEVKNPAHTLPRAIFLTLGLSTLLYILVVWVALSIVPQAELSAASAPLSLVFQRATGASPALISAIAIVATVNGIIVQMIMASRVLYGMASRKLLPGWIAEVNSATRTPLNATGLVVVCTLVAGLAFPLERLAEITSMLTLSIFALVNVALVALKRRGEPAPLGCFTVPVAVPAVGCLLCVGLLLAGIGA